MPQESTADDRCPRMGHTQAVISISLALIPCAYMFLLGCFLFVAPGNILELAFSCFKEEFYIKEADYSAENPSSLNIRMARLVGCVLLGQILSCLVLLYSIIEYHVCQKGSEGAQSPPLRPDEYATVLDKFRSAVASLFIMALFLIVAGLLDDRTSTKDDEPCDTIQSTFIIGSGAFVLIFACASMMVSFWPNKNEFNDENNGQGGTGTCNLLCCPTNRNLRSEDIQTSANDAHVPLLSSERNVGTDGHVEQQDDGTTFEASDNNDASANNADAHGNAVQQQMEDEPTSRIRGTTRLLKLAAPQVFYLYIGCAVLLIRLPFSLSIPHFVSTTLGAVSRGDFAQARLEIALLFILGSIDAALDFWCVFLFGYANQRIVRGVRIDTFRSILRQEVAFFDRTTSGELASRLNSDCGEMAGDLTWFFRFSIESIVRITGIVSYMLIRCPILGGCAITIIPVVALVNKIYGNWLNKNAIQVQDALAAANHVAQETFSCVRTVIAFASENQEYQKYKEKIDHQYNLNIRQLFITGVYYMIISTFLINTVVQSTLLFIGTALIQHGKLTGEVLLAFMLYQGQLQSETMNLFQSYTSLVKSSGAGDKVFSLLDRSPDPPGTGSSSVTATEIEEEEVRDEEMSSPQSEVTLTASNVAAAGASHSSCSVLIKNVEFTYPCRADNKVLNDFKLEIAQGTTVALVGASGCGKSTVVGLLQRFYDPDAGCILFDGEDLKNLDVKKHRRRIGIVTQDPILFKGTILSNITYGCPTATREQAVEAAKMANAHAFVSSFPDGYDTDVGERGVQLSGGQKQRIAIARAIIRKPALLLLDEATSALDAESEQAVQDALDTLLRTNKDMTTVIVAHRLRTVRNSDMIAYIENGRVAESGTHNELLKLPKGHYRKMVERAGSDGQLPDQ